MNLFNRLFKSFDYFLMLILFIGGLTLDSHSNGGQIMFNGVWFIPFLYMVAKFAIRQCIVTIKELLKEGDR